MTLVSLNPQRNRRGVGAGGKAVLSAKPFYLGDRSTFVHRVRHVNQFEHHVGVWFWCGNLGRVGAVAELHSSPPKDHYLCSRCEMIARIKRLKPRLPSARIGRMAPTKV